MKIINTKNKALIKFINKEISSLVQLLSNNILTLEKEINSFLSCLQSQNRISDWHFMANPNSSNFDFILEVFDKNHYPMEFHFSLSKNP